MKCLTPIEALLRAYFEATEIPLVLLEKGSDHSVQFGAVTEDPVWLQTHFTNVKIEHSHLFPNGTLIMNPKRSLGIFFEHKDRPLAPSILRSLSSNWRLIETYFKNQKSMSKNSISEKERAFSNRVKQWVQFRQFYSVECDAMGNSLFYGKQGPVLIASISNEFNRFVFRIRKADKLISGKLPAGFPLRDTHYLLLPGFKGRHSRQLLFTKQRPFTKKDRQMMVDLYRLASIDPEQPMQEAVEYVDLIFNSLVHQNNPKQLLVQVFQKLRQLLHVDFFLLAWPSFQSRLTRWESSGLGDQALRMTISERLEEDGGKGQSEKYMGFSGFLEFAYSESIIPNQIYPCQPLIPELCSVKELFFMQLAMDDRPLGLFFMGTHEQNDIFIDKQEHWEKLGKFLHHLLKTATYDCQREERFLEIGHAYTKLLEDYSKLGETSRIQEEQLMVFNTLDTTINAVFKMFSKIKTMSPGSGYLDQLFHYVKSVTGASLVCLTYLNHGEFQFIYQSEGPQFKRLQFLELNGGCYHDVIFSGMPIYWDGSGQRPFLLPSGHPVLNSAYIVPISNFEGDEGVFVVGNTVDGDMNRVLRNLIQQIVTLECDALFRCMDEMN